MKFLLTFVIICLFIILLLPGLIFKLLRFWLGRKVGNSPQDAGNYYRRQNYRTEQEHKPRRGKKKIFSRTDGEYVDFEEITVTGDSTEREEIHYEKEEQVTDAEWTDIK